MILLFFISIILYSVVFLLAKSNIINGLTRVLSVVNTALVVGLSVIVLVKTGLLRLVASLISFLLIRLSEFFGAMF